MNKLMKVIVAILGGCNEVMNMLIPISVALLLVIVVGIHGLSLYLLLTVGVFSSLFRGAKVWIK